GRPDRHGAGRRDRRVLGPRRPPAGRGPGLGRSGAGAGRPGQRHRRRGPVRNGGPGICTRVTPMDGTPSPAANAASATPPRRRDRQRRFIYFTAGVLMIYLAAAYVVAPLAWDRYAHRHPALDDVPGITHTADGIPGDPVNVALIGTQAELVKI